MENQVSVDDFQSPRKLDNAGASGIAVALPSVVAGVSLWWVPLERTREEVAHLALTLSAEERARAQKFGTDALRDRWIAGRASLRMLLGQALGIAPSAVRLARGRRGRPQLDDHSTIDFNVSHTCGMALVGITDALPADVRIGVDVEHGERRVNADGLSRKFLTERERGALVPLEADERRRGFLRLWTCKEAMSKATGDALSAPFRKLDVTTDRGLALMNGPAPYLPSDWQLHAVPMPEGFLATVAIWRPAGIVATGSP